MDDKLMISADDVAGIKSLYQKAMAEKDEAAIQLLAEEAVQAEMFANVVAEATSALELGPAEAVDVLQAFHPALAEAVDPRKLLGIEV